MLRAQRIVLMVGLVVIALLLHVNACQWRWRALGWQETTGNAVIVFWTEHPPANAAGAPLLGGVAASRYTAIFPDAGVPEGNRFVAVVAGIVAPLALLMIVAMLGLGWRYQERVRRGLCATCGYDLRGHPAPTRPAGEGERGDGDGPGTPMAAKPATPPPGRCPECGSAVPAAAARG